MKNLKKLFEGLEQNDLARLVQPSLHIDEFVSKMGDDKDIIVAAFTVDGKEPANDLMNFLERGYDWILDADVSAGEFGDGEYMVFAEMRRDGHAIANIIEMIKDVCRLTDNTIEDWHFCYHKDSRKHPITSDAISDIVPLDKEEYQAKYGNDDVDDDGEEAAQIATDVGGVEADSTEAELLKMMEAARVPMKRKDFTPQDTHLALLKQRAGLL